MTAYNVVSPTAMVNGQPEDVSIIKSNFDAIAAVLNGNIDNSNIAAAAAIVYSKLNLGNSITNSDIAAAAGIVKTKLAALGIVNADVDPAAAIVYSKLALATSLKRSDMATGLNGPPGTQVDYTEVTTSPTFGATTAATAVALITGGAVTYDGTTPVWVEFWCPAAHNSGAGNMIAFQLYDGATDLGTLARLNVNATFDNGIYGARKLTPSAASHTYSVRGWVNTGTGTMDCGAGGAGVYLPAFLKVSVA